MKHRLQYVAVRLLIFAASLAVSLIAFEVASRMYLSYGQPNWKRVVLQHQEALQRGLKGLKRYVPHPYLSYAPADVVMLPDGCTIDGTKFTFDKPANALRIACLGGSTTKHTYPQYLREALQPSFPDQTIEVMDWGCQGWTIVESALNYALRVRAFRPDAVILHHGINDIAPRVRSDHVIDYSHYRRSYQPRTLGTFDWLASRSKAAAWIELVWGFRLTDLDEATVQPHNGKLLAYGTMPGDASLRSYTNAMDTIYRLAEADGTTMTIAGMVYSVTAALDEYHAKIVVQHNRASEQFAEDRGLVYVPTQKAIGDYPDQFYDQCHLTEYGDRIKAQMLASAVADSLGKPPRVAVRQITDSPDEPALEIAWQFPDIAVKEVHFWTQSDGKPRKFVGRLLDPQDNRMIWNAGAPNIANAFKDGPQVGQEYLISLWVVDTSGNVSIPFYASRPIVVK